MQSFQKILKVLEAVEAERTVAGFLGRALEQIESLVPFDHACATLSTQVFWRPQLVHARHSSIWKDYFHHYASLDPLPSPVGRWWPVVGVIDPAGFGDIKFQKDFAAGNRITQTLAITNLPRVSEGAQGFCLGLFRGPGPVFSADELAGLETLYPHLQNLFLLLVAPGFARRQSFLAEASRRGFTPRELDIVELLCQRMSVSEIAERLFISRHTVEKHLEHVYAKLRVSGWRKACDSVFDGEPPTSAPSSSLMFVRDT